MEPSQIDVSLEENEDNHNASNPPSPTSGGVKVRMIENDEISVTRTLYNYLCLEADRMCAIDGSATESYAVFENLVEDELIVVPYDCQLRKLLAAHGWRSNCFEGDIDIYQLRQDVGNIYLSSCISDKSSVASENILLMFCPDLLLTVLKERNDTTLAPFERVFQGTCMLADISGFTNLASSLCRAKSGALATSPVQTLGNSRTIRDFLNYAGNNNGSLGLDELQSKTNVFLGTLVQTIYAYGGDVIEFAGDALLCVFTDDFPAKPGEPHSVRACKCADTLIRDSMASAAVSKLSLHVALSCGDLRLAVLGGHLDRWTHVLSGKCVAELSSCIDNAKINEVVITPLLYRELQALSTVVSGIPSCADMTSSGNFLLHWGDQEMPRSVSKRSSMVLHGYKNSPETLVDRLKKSPMFESVKMAFNDKLRRNSSSFRAEGSGDLVRGRAHQSHEGLNDVLHAFIPHAVTGAVMSGTVSISELRQVTTMFLMLNSFTASSYDDPLSLQSFFLEVQAALHATGGFLRQFLIDDKGCVVIGMWGMPSFSHKNNGFLALRCSVMIQMRAKELRHRCSIGIATGLVFCSSIGSAIRRDYVGIGDRVNLAARLMSKAKGRIFIDENTHAILSVSTRKSLELSEALYLKGIEGAFRPYEFIGFEVPEMDDEMDVFEALNFIGSEMPELIQQHLDRLAALYIRSEVSKTLQKEWASIAKKNKLSAVPAESHSRALSAKPSVSVFAVLRHQNSVDTVPTTSTKRSSIFDIFSFGTTDRQTSRRADSTIVNSASNYVKFLIVEGLEGLSLENFAEHFKVQVLKRKRKISSFFIEGREEDKITPYGVIGRLCIELIKEKMTTPFTDEFDQRRVLRALLYKANPSCVLNGHIDRQMNELEIALHLDWSEEIDIDVDEAALPTDDSPPVPRYSASTDQGFVVVGSDVPMLELFRVLLADCCTALVIENAHFCDELSWLMLEHLQTLDGCNFLVFLTMYPLTLSTITRNTVISQSSVKTSNMLVESFENTNVEPLSFQNIIGNTSRAHFVNFKTLRKEDINQLLCKILNVPSVTESLLNIVYDVSLANPLWCTEIALFIRNRGVDQFLQKSKSSNPLSALITFRFDSLSTVQQIVIKYASVIGDSFTFDCLLAIIPIHYDLRVEVLRAEGLRAILSELVHLGFIHSNSNNTIYTFQHQLLRDTIYKQWPPSHVATVHNSIAVYIEAAEKELHGFYPRLCYHYKMSQANHAETYKYTVKAADQYVSICAYKEGLIYSRTAFEMASTRTELKELLVVVRVALHDINPTIFRRIRNSVLGSHVSINKQSAGFDILKREIKAKLEDLNKADDLEVKRESAPLPWQASYAQNKVDHNGATIFQVFAIRNSVSSNNSRGSVTSGNKINSAGSALSAAGDLPSTRDPSVHVVTAEESSCRCVIN